MSYHQVLCCLTIMIHHLENGAECIFYKLVDKTKLRGMVGTPEDCGSILKMMEKLTDRFQQAV